MWPWAMPQNGYTAATRDHAASAGPSAKYSQDLNQNLTQDSPASILDSVKEQVLLKPYFGENLAIYTSYQLWYHLFIAF